MLTIKLQRYVADFERAVLEALRRVLPEVQVRGCAFHWQLAVFRRIQNLGLAVLINIIKLIQIIVTNHSNIYYSIFRIYLIMYVSFQTEFSESTRPSFMDLSRN